MKLSLSKIEKYYQSQGKSIKGVAGINFSLSDDDRFIVATGESGSGKSTLGKILAGLLEIDEGKFVFDGIDVSTLDKTEKEDLFNSRVSYVSQDESLIESLSARSNIAIALFRKGLTKKEANSQAKAALSEVGLNPESNIKVSFLSGGERQRVAIARALATKAPLIVFDEPTGNLDKAAAEKVNSLIGSLSEKRLIFYITHDYEETLPYATRHLTLQDGEIIKDEIINVREKDKQVVEEEKHSSKQSRLKACLSASCALLFSSGKTSFLTIIGAFLMTVIILGSALRFTSFLANSTDDGKKVISDGYFDKTDQTHDAFGNKVSLKKVSINSALPQLSDDSFADYSSLLDKTDLHLFLEDEVSAIKNNTNIDGFSFSGFQFQVAPYIPFKTKAEKTASFSENEERASLLIKNISDENPIYLSLNSMVGQKFFLTFFDALNTSTLDSKTNSDTTLLENAPEVTIDSFATTDNPYLEDGKIYLSASSKTMRILEEQIKDIHIGIKYPDLTWISLNSINSQEVDVSIDCEGSTIKHSESLIFDKSKPDKIQLPSKYQSKSFFFIMNGTKIPSSAFSSGTYFSESSQIEFVDLTPSQEYLDGNFYFPLFLLIKDYYESKSSFNVFFSSPQEAFSFSKSLSSQEYFSFYFASYSPYFSTLDFYALPYESKVRAGWILLAGVLIIIGISFVFKLIQEKIDSQDQDNRKVLKKIGYREKDVFLIKFFNYGIIFLAVSLIVYSLTISGLINNVLNRLVIFCPAFVALSPLLILIVICLLSLPRIGAKHL